MTPIAKLAITGIVVLIAGVLAALLSGGEQDAEGEAAKLDDRSPLFRALERRAEMVDPSELPKAARVTSDYLDDRWGQFEDKGQVAPTIDGMGDLVFFSKDAIVGKGFGGKPVYARSVIRPMTVTRKGTMADLNPNAPRARLKWEPRNRLKAERLPLEDILTKGSGDRTSGGDE